MYFPSRDEKKYWQNPNPSKGEREDEHPHSSSPEMKMQAVLHARFQ